MDARVESLNAPVMVDVSVTEPAVSLSFRRTVANLKAHNAVSSRIASIDIRVRFLRRPRRGFELPTQEFEPMLLR